MKALKWINAVSFALMITVNALANLLPIGGNTTGQISEAYPNLFAPAPITFAIWGVIYVLLLVFIIYQFGAFDRGLFSTKVRDDLGLWFSLSCALNIVWIFLWHYQLIAASTLCIAGLLIVLIVMNGKIKAASGSYIQRMAATAGLSLYYGWIIAATIANVTVLLTKIGWTGGLLGAEFWTSAVLLIGTAIAVAVVLLDHNRIAAVSIIWAYAGILLRHLSPAYFAGSHPFIIVTGFLCVTIILAVMMLPCAKYLSIRHTQPKEKQEADA